MVHYTESIREYSMDLGNRITRLIDVLFGPHCDREFHSPLAPCSIPYSSDMVDILGRSPGRDSLLYRSLVSRYVDRPLPEIEYNINDIVPPRASAQVLAGGTRNIRTVYLLLSSKLGRTGWLVPLNDASRQQVFSSQMYLHTLGIADIW